MDARTRRGIAVMCALAFCLGCQPSEPFLTPYMTVVKGLNSSQIDDNVYPFWTWSFFIVLLPIGGRPTSFCLRTTLLLTSGGAMWCSCCVGIAAEAFGYRAIIFVGVLGAWLSLLAFATRGLSPTIDLSMFHVQRSS